MSIHYIDTTPPKLRDPAPCIDPTEQDFVFQVLDAKIRTLGDVPNAVGIRSSDIDLHGVTEKCNTAFARFRGYLTYFYLSLPPDAEDKTVSKKYKDDILRKLRAYKFKRKMFDDNASLEYLYFNELADVICTPKIPLVGFVNEEPKPFLLFTFYTYRSFKEFHKALRSEDFFPPPTKDDIAKGDYKNDFIVCEYKDVEEMKFFDQMDIISAGWVRLVAGTYNFTDVSTAQYSWTTDTIKPILDKETIAPVQVDSIDIEAAKTSEGEGMPDPTNPDDVTASIGHAIQRSDRLKDPTYIIWTWIPPQSRIPGHVGPHCVFPTKDKEGNPLPYRKIIVMEYDSEEDMFNAWAAWWSGQDVSSDVIIGWNILGFDMKWIYKRLETLCYIEEDSFVWGRLKGVKTRLEKKKIESKAIAYREYAETPSPGIVFLDEQIVCERDVTLRLHNYKLETVAQHYLGEGKDPVHYSEITGLFFGTPEQRGRLFYYNIQVQYNIHFLTGQDCSLVLELFFKLATWPKCVNVARVNRVLLNLLCTRGQQIRVYGGLHYVAAKNNYVVWRPNYHPVLDTPIFDNDDEVSGEYDAEKLMEYWMDKFKQQENKPRFNIVRVNENGEAVSYPHEELNALANEGLCNAISKEETENTAMDVVESKEEEGEVVEPPTKKRRQSPGKLDVMSQNYKLENCVTASGLSASKVIKMLDASKSNKGKRKAPHNLGNFTVKQSFDRDDDEGMYQASVADILRSNKTKQSIVDIQFSNISKDIHGNTEDEDEEVDTGKGFSGGYVMEPIPGWYENIPILDFNSLYPNLMMTYFLCVSLLVIDYARYGNVPGVDYLDIIMNEKTTYRFAQNRPGVLIQHTRNLVSSRKVAQGIMTAYDGRIEQERLLLKSWLDDATVSTSLGKEMDMMTIGLKVMIEKSSIITDPNELEKYKKELTVYKDEVEKFKLKYKESCSIPSLSKEAKAIIISDPNANDKQSLWHLYLQRLEYERKVMVEQFEAEREITKSEVPVLEDMEELLEASKQYIQNPKAHPVIKEKLKLSVTMVESLYETASQLRDELDKEIGEGIEPKMTLKSPHILSLMLLTIAMFQAESTNFNAKQNELKVGSNSTFGFPGAGKMKYDSKTKRLKRTGMLMVKPVSACVTYMGRQSIEKAKRIAEAKVPGSKVIYIDTDSIFWDALLAKTQEGFVESFRLAKELVKEINAQFTGTMRIEHEKTARVIAIYTAKCYVLDKYMSVDDPGKIEIKGLSFNKRNYCKFVKIFGTTLMNILLRKRDIEKAKQYVRDETMKLVMTDFPRTKEVQQLKDQCEKYTKALGRATKARDAPAMEKIQNIITDIEKKQLTLHKEIVAKYELLSLYQKLNKQNYNGRVVPHAKLAERIEARTGRGPKSGDSVKYLPIYTPGANQKGIKMEDRIEDFDYVIEQNLNIDLLWFLQNQILRTIEKVFSILMTSPADLLDDSIGYQMGKQMNVSKTVDESDFGGMFEILED